MDRHNTCLVAVCLIPLICDYSVERDVSCLYRRGLDPSLLHTVLFIIQYDEGVLIDWAKPAPSIIIDSLFAAHEVINKAHANILNVLQHVLLDNAGTNKV